MLKTTESEFLSPVVKVYLEVLTSELFIDSSVPEPSDITNQFKLYECTVACF